MRYLVQPDLSDREAVLLPARGKHYAPSGAVTLPDGAWLRREGTSVLDVSGELLAVHADTASWAFLEPEEETLFQRADGTSVGALAASYEGPRAEVHDLVARLWRRGLLTVDGTRSVHDDVLRDGSDLQDEGHLVELLLTERCNLGCTYCLAGTRPDMPVMSDETGRRAIDLAWQMSEAPAITFEFSGGEPFMRFDLMRELTTYAREHPLRRGRGVWFCVQTNATLLDERRVRWLRDNEVVVGVSLDGDPASHDVSRPTVSGRGSFSRVQRGLRLLREAEVPFGVLVVLNRSNAASAERLLDFLGQYGIRHVKVNPVSYLGTARRSWDAVGLSQEDVVAYLQDLVQLVVQRGDDVVEDNLRAMLEHVLSKRRATRCLRRTCGAGDTFQTVAADGSLYPCGRTTQTPAMRLAGVGDHLASLSAPARDNVFIGQIRRRRPEDLDGCATCDYRQLCQAGCSAQAFERYGTVRHRTPECHTNKTLYPWLLRWLCFNPPAVQQLNRAGWFGTGALLVHAPLRADAAAAHR